MLRATRRLPRLRLNWGKPARRRAGSFHWTFVIEHSLSIGVEKRSEP